MCDRLFRFIVRMPFIIIIPVFILTVYFGFQIQNIQIDTDIQALIPSGGVTGEFVEHYSGEEQDTFDYFVFVVTSDNLYCAQGLALLYETIQKIAEIDIFDEPVSPFTFTTFERIGTRLRPANPAPQGRAPESEEEIQLFRERLEKDPFARNLIISEDASSLAVYFPQPVKTSEYTQYVQKIETILEPLEEFYEVRKIGTILYAEHIQHYLFEDLTRLLILALLFMVVLFYSGFKALRAVILPMMVVAIGTTWSLGAIALLGYSVTVISVALPPIILALGSSYAIHMLNQYIRDSMLAGESKHDSLWMVTGIRQIAKTILIAGITTLIGFSSLLFSQIDQIREFGVGAMAGITACIVLSLTFLPASLALFPHPRHSTGKTVVEGKLTSLMIRTGPHVLRQYKRYVCVSVLMLILGFILYPHIEQKTDFLDYYPDDNPVIIDTHYIVEHFGSFHHIYLTLTAPEKERNYFLNVDVLKQVYEFEKAVKAIPDVGYIASFPGYVAFMNDLISGEEEIPESRGLILMVSRIFKLASIRGIDDVGSFADEDFSELTYTLRLYDSKNNAFIYDEDLKKRLTEIHEYGKGLPDGVEYSFWGWNLIFADLADMLKHDQNMSLLISAIGVALIAMIFFRSFVLGIVSLIPLASGLFLTYICMAVFNIPMDMTSAMTASIAIGVGVDDAIHFLIHYRNARKLGLSVHRAVTDTIAITGRPIFLTSLAIVGGLIILVFASFKPITFFGALITLALVGACLGTILVLPSWLLFANRVKNQFLAKAQKN